MTNDEKQRKRMCKSKKSFYTQREANIIARRFGGRSYECPYCFCWHLTKKDFYHGSISLLSKKGNER